MDLLFVGVFHYSLPAVPYADAGANKCKRDTARELKKVTDASRFRSTANPDGRLWRAKRTSAECHERRSQVYVSPRGVCRDVNRVALLSAILPRIALGLRDVDKSQERLSDSKHAAWDLAAAAGLPRHVPARAIRLLHCLQR
jgi:hypothetical protein